MRLVFADSRICPDRSREKDLSKSFHPGAKEKGRREERTEMGSSDKVLCGFGIGEDSGRRSFAQPKTGAGYFDMP